MGIMETLRGMKDYEANHPILPMEKKQRGLKEVKKGCSNGNEGVKISNGNISKENRRKYIASLLGRCKK